MFTFYRFLIFFYIYKLMKVLCIITGELRGHLTIINDFYHKLILPNEMDIYYFLSSSDKIYNNELNYEISILLRGFSSKLLGIHYQDDEDNIDECRTMVFDRYKRYVQKNHKSKYLPIFLDKLESKNIVWSKIDYKLAKEISENYSVYNGLHQWYKLQRSLELLSKSNYDKYTHIMRIRPDIDFNDDNINFKKYVKSIKKEKKWVFLGWDFIIFAKRELFVLIFNNFFKYYKQNGIPSQMNKALINKFCTNTSLKTYATMYNYNFNCYSEHYLLDYFVKNNIFGYDIPYHISIKNVRNLNKMKIKMLFTSENKKNEDKANKVILNHHNYKISIQFLKNYFRYWKLEDWYKYCKNKNITIKRSYFYENNNIEKINFINLNERLSNYFGKEIINEV